MFRPLCVAIPFMLMTSMAMAQQRTGVQAKAFPYQVFTRALSNGLHVVIIPAPEFKDMVTYATAVFAGSRNETERGKTGLAHLFEHEMFLHQYGGVKEGYEDQIRAMGAFNNAWTDYDMTFYHPTTFTSNLAGPIGRSQEELPGLIQLEADRFQHLTIERKTFELEAGAVLGEYRRVFSNPTEKMIESLSEKAFPTHPYGHTVMGYLSDVENMPQAWDTAWEFYHNYYQPNSLALVIVGDVKPEQLMPVIERAYSEWKPLPVPQIAPETEPRGEVDVHVPWEAEVSPHVMVGYHTPAARLGSKETAVGQIISELLVSRSAPLFQKLRYQKQTVTDLNVAMEPFTTDPMLLLLDSELMLDRFQKYGPSYATEVKSDMIAGIEALKHFSTTPNAAKTLEVIKSRTRNNLLGSLSTTENIAQIFASYYRFGRDPDAIDKAMATIGSLTPLDIDAYAQKYFTQNRRVVATLWFQARQSATPEVK
jgi:zinc protease